MPFLFGRKKETQKHTRFGKPRRSQVPRTYRGSKLSGTAFTATPSSIEAIQKCYYNLLASLSSYNWAIAGKTVCFRLEWHTNRISPYQGVQPFKTTCGLRRFHQIPQSEDALLQAKMISVTLSQQIKPMALHLLVPARVYPLFFLIPPSFFSWSSLPLVQSILWSLLLQIQGSALDMFHVCANVCTVTINVSSSLWMDLRFFTKSYVCVCQGLALDKEEHNYIHRFIYCESQKVGKVQLYHDSAAMKTAWNLLDSLQSDRRQEPQLVGCASTCSPASANWACLTSWQGTNSVWCLWQTFWDVRPPGVSRIPHQRLFLKGCSLHSLANQLALQGDVHRWQSTSHGLLPDRHRALVCNTRIC